MLLSAGEYVIKTLGGLTGTAKALEGVTGEKVPVSTVQGWKERGTIPQTHWRTLIKAAEDAGNALTLNDFLTEHFEPEAEAEPAKATAA